MIHQNIDLHFHFIRHGESEANRQQIVGGGDAPLTEKGIKEVRALERRLVKEKAHFDLMFSSPMIRAVKTARLIASAVGYDQQKIILVPALAELCYGDWEFKTRSDILTDNILNSMNSKEKWFVFPGPKGDSKVEIQMRTVRWLWEEVIRNPACYSLRPCHVAIVGHAVTFKCLFQYLIGFDPSYIWKMYIFNASLSRFIFNHKGWFVVCLNDTGHLSTIK